MIVSHNPDDEDDARVPICAAINEAFRGLMKKQKITHEDVASALAILFAHHAILAGCDLDAALRTVYLAYEHRWSEGSRPKEPKP